MNVSDFKLSCSRSGVWHFAYTKVGISSTLKSQVVNSIAKPVDFNACEIDESSHPDWFKAAVSGIDKALRLIKIKRDESFTIEIICIKGVEVDSQYDDIEVCSFLAVVKAVMGEDINYSLDVVNSKWNVKFAEEYNWNYEYQQH